MKKMIRLFIITLLSSQVRAQESPQLYKPFKVVTSIGTTIVFKSPSYPGILLSVEPNYRISKKFDVGLLFQTATVNDPESDYVDAIDVGSIHALADYHLKGKNVHPFFGAGVGYSLFDKLVFTYDGVSNPLFVSSNFSALARFGISYRHLNIATEYYLIQTPNPNYINLKIGIAIGGGKR